jgi:hypothetical protein
LSKDLQRLFELKENGYRITEIHISVDKQRTPNERADLVFEKDDKKVNLSSSEEELFSYVIRLHGIPHIEDDGSDFVYIDDPNKYFDLEKKVVDLICGIQQEWVVCERKLDSDFLKLTNKVVTSERNWILAEKGTTISNTKLCQIFYDVGFFTVKNYQTNFKIASKEKISLNEIQNLLQESKKADVAICFSAFLLTPRFPPKKDNESGIVLGIIVYDLKNCRTLSFNLNSASQLQRRMGDVKKHGLWDCVLNIFDRTKNNECFKSYLPLPINIRDFTPLPWFCFAFINGISPNIVFKKIKLDLPLFLVFGAPLLLLNKPSYDFDSEKQRAFVMLRFKENGKFSDHQVRFDMSGGEPRLHIDYEVHSEDKRTSKIVGHYVLNYTDIWDFSENLAIGFLSASAYDVNFETKVIPHSLENLAESFRNNPSTLLPLFVRSRAAKPFKAVKGNPKLSQVLIKKAKKQEVRDENSIKELEQIGLLKDGDLTILGDIVYSRLLQSKQLEQKA